MRGSDLLFLDGVAFYKVLFSSNTRELCLFILLGNICFTESDQRFGYCRIDNNFLKEKSAICGCTVHCILSTFNTEFARLHRLTKRCMQNPIIHFLCQSSAKYKT